MTALIVGAATVTFASLGLTAAAGASTQLASTVSQSAVGWTPNVSAGPTVQPSTPYCNTTFFGGGNLSCQSEVYSTAYVNGDVVVSGAFTEACKPGSSATNFCAPGTQVVRDDIFAYQAGTGLIDPNFTPLLNAGPAWNVVAGPAGSNAVFVGGAFTTVDGISHKGLVELSVNPGVTTGPTADGSVVTSFKASVSGFARVLALSPDGGALYVGGQFTSIDSTAKFADGAPVESLARLDPLTGALDSTFAFTLGDPITGLPTKIEAMSLSPDGTHLAFSGTALQVNGKARPRLAIVNTGTTLDAPSSLSDWTAPILANNCSIEHDYVRGLDFSPDGTFVVTADTGYTNDGSTHFSACDAVARFDVTAANTTTTGTSVDVPPAWVDYAGGDSFYSVAIAGGVVYTGGHNRWVNNYCGQDHLCGPNAELTGGLSALDANTGIGLAWWHPLTIRGQGTMYMSTFPAGTDDGPSAGLYIGTDVDVIAGGYHSEEAIFPLAANTSSNLGGPIPSGEFNEEGGNNLGGPMCIDDPTNSSTAGSPVRLNICTNSGEQNWSEVNGTIEVNGMCLAPAGGTAVSGTEVVLSACNGSSAQQWTQGIGNTLVNGPSAAGGICLDAPGLNGTAGSQLDIWTCNGGANQVWPLPAAVGPPSGSASGEIFSQELQKDTQVPCLDDAKDSTATNNKVQLWTCTGTPEQVWTIVRTGSDFTIELGNNCLDSLNSIATGSEPVVLNRCTGASTQQWTVAANYEVVNVGTTSRTGEQYCLDDPRLDTVNGTQLDTWTCNGGANQQWRLPSA